jgi:hypothetical protein
MKKAILLLLFLFSLGTLSAVFIDYDVGDTMNDMYEYKQGSTVYYIDQPVRYYLETDLYLLPADSDLWLAGTGSYSDIHSGDSVCEGEYRYRLRTHAYARNSVSGKTPSVSAAVTGPGDWPDCTGTCPEGDKYVLWSTSAYDAHLGDYGDVGRQISPDSVYGWRGLTVRESGTGPFDSNERADMAVVMKGSTQLRKGSTTVAGPFTLSGTSYSYAPSSTIGVYTSSYTQYSFTQRVSIGGGLVAVFWPEGYPYTPPTGDESYWAYQDLGNSQNDYYTETITSPAALLNVYDENNVGIVDPNIQWVDIGDDGVFTTYAAEPGTTVPVRIRMNVPNRPSNFYALPFEFYNIQGSGSGTSFAVTSNPGTCSSMFPNINGGWFLPHSSYTTDILGTLHIPEGISAGTHNIAFSVSWRSCSGYDDCDGNGVTGTDGPIYIPIDIIPDEPLPDLTCSVEPTKYIDDIPPGPDGFASLGQGVEDWEVTVTNIGPGNATVDATNFLCSMMAFNAYSNDGSAAFDPYYYAVLTSTVPGQITSGDSVTFDVEGAPAACLEGTEGYILGFASVNVLDTLLPLPACTPYMIVEENKGWDNLCFWSAPCVEPQEPGECTIIPSNVNNPPSGSEHDFTLLCDGVPCTGAVVWTEADVGDDVADMTGSSSTGATAQVITYEDDDEISGTTILTATVDYPENMICNATITLNVNDGPPIDEDDYCYCDPTPQTGYPGTEHDFELFCVEDDEDTGHCSGTWSIYDGEEYLEEWNAHTWWWWGKVKSGLMLTEPDDVNIRARTEISGYWVECYCQILLPSMDCYDFI